jgi:hypothetical protein
MSFRVLQKISGAPVFLAPELAAIELSLHGARGMDHENPNRDDTEHSAVGRRSRTSADHGSAAASPTLPA